MRIVLFDIDGTLLLSGGAGLRALRRVFRRKYGVEDAVDGIEFHGHTDGAILRAIGNKWLGRALTPDEMAEIEELYVEDVRRVLTEDAAKMHVLPGARELVHELHARDDVVLGLATGNFERAAWAKLGCAELDGYFGFGGFGSDSEDRLELTRRAADRGREQAGAGAPVLVVGDTIHDVRCALGVGADCLAVATGNASETALAAAGARWTVESLASPAARAALGLV